MPIHPHDTATFTRIYSDYFARLFTFAKRFVDSDDAADVLSEVFMGVWKSHNEFTNDQALTTYLYRAVRNRCLNSLQQKHPVRDIPDIPETAVIEIEAAVIQRLVDLLDELPTVQRKIIELRYFEGLSVSQIAQATGMNEKTVHSNCWAALKRLRIFKHTISL